MKRKIAFVTQQRPIEGFLLAAHVTATILAFTSRIIAAYGAVQVILCLTCQSIASTTTFAKFAFSKIKLQFRRTKTRAKLLRTAICKFQILTMKQIFRILHCSQSFKNQELLRLHVNDDVHFKQYKVTKY